MKYLYSFIILFFVVCAKSQCPNDPPIIISTYEYVEEDTLVVDIVAFNIENLVVSQFGITYNADNLSFYGLEEASLTLSPPNVNEVSPGEIRFLWLGGVPGMVDPINLPDGSILTKFKFVINQLGEYQVSISSLAGFMIEFGSFSNGQVEALCYQIGGQSSILQGNIFFDENQNCLSDDSESSLSNWQLTLTDINTNKEYPLFSNNEGLYYTFIEPGNYNFVSNPTNPVWSVCENSFNLIVTETDSVYFQDFHAQSLVDCPSLQVDVSAPFLRRCFPNFHQVRYCNKGTIEATDVEIELILDPYLEFVNSSNPNYSVSGDTITFLIGDVAVGVCENILVETYLSCDDTVLGQTHCVSAHIYPDTLCAPVPAEWDGSSIQLGVNCEEDSVRFKISNRGLGDMTNPSELIVVEDDVMRDAGNIQLKAGESIFKSYEANGTTYRLIANQVDFHPGHSNPTLAIEGCAEAPTEEFSLGFVSLFTEDEQNAFISIDCQENIGSFDPNDKLATPKGYSEQRLIEKATMLEYMIRFQNTGTDTAFRVVVLDTLSEKLDLSSINILSTSHPSTIKMLGERVISFEFDNIKLVDSLTNEPASHGFIKYAIYPETDVQEGDILHNSASIYFDFNSPVLTNLVEHTIGDNFFDITSSIIPTLIEQNHTEVLIFPNPVKNHATVKFGNEMVPSEFEYSIYSLDGKLMQKKQLGMDEVISCELLPKGVYVIQFISEGKGLGKAKFVVL